MKKYILPALFFIAGIMAVSAQKQAYRTFTPGGLWNDDNGVHINAHGGGVLYDKGKYYWFGEHKIEGSEGNRAHVGVHCYSSVDLYNWKDEGIVLSVDPEGSGSDIEKGCILERPKVIYNRKTRKYVMWFHLELKSEGYKAARSAVAVSDRITGPYVFIRSMRPNAGYWPENVLELHKSGNIPSLGQSYTGGGMPGHTDSLNVLGRDFEGGQMARDMTLFVDDDGKAYHIYSSEENSTTHIAELSDDYLSHTGRYMRVFVNRYMEAPAIMKRSGKYYFIGSGCTGWAPNAARSAVAESIWGPWEELGNPCRGPESELTFGGQSTYILKVNDMPDTYIFMADLWRPDNAIDGRYIWLPVTFEDEKPLIYWQHEWSVADPRVPADEDLVTYQLPGNEIYRNGWIDFNKNGIKDIYEDPNAPLEDRIEDLLRQMTVDEKTCQMVTLYGYQRILADDLPTPEWKEKLWKDGMGAIDEHLNGFRQWGQPPSTNAFVWPASRHAWALNEVQRFFVEETRLGIPVDFTNEGIRGVESYIATNFPTQLGLGHTWNRELIRQVGYITGREGRLLGYTNVYAPVLDVGRDQRWGRYEEVYGESPFLVAELGVAMTQGMQTDFQVASTAKHFIAYSNNKGGREGLARVDPQMSPREVENIHVYPWKRVIKEAGLLGAMSSYNDYDGFPVQSSCYWLTTRLRGEMGFKGYVVSDSDAVEYLHSKHGTSENMKESVRQSVEAGLNVRCTFRSPESYVLPLRELVREGTISMETIDDRVRDILRVKFMVGLFDAPYQTDLKAADSEVNSVQNQDVALQASRESIVLLKNDGGLLPLSSENVKKISVCGPNADDASYALTHYGPLAVEVKSVLDGIRDKMEGRAEVLYTKGCDIVDANWPESEIIPFPLTADEQAEIDKAVANALESDVAVVVLGENSRTCGENRSRSSLDLPGRQQDLLKAVYETGTPVVLVIISGRPNSINWADRYIPAILETWYPGSQGGTAIADVIFGDYNPGGKLTVTFPRTVGQIPFNFPSKPSSQIDGGRVKGPNGDMSRVNGALYPFGYGLSYTTFEYSDLQVSPSVIAPTQNVTVRFNITNTGGMEGDEVVQLYTRDVVSSVTTYEKNLRGFERVNLKPGETKEVVFTIVPDHLVLFNENEEWVVEPGDFRIMIGASSADIRLSDKITVVPYEGASLQDNAKDGKNDKQAEWTGGRGDFLTITVKDSAPLGGLSILWGQLPEKPVRFEIQASSGGGQFLTVFQGEAAATGTADYSFDPVVASDIRILINSGKAIISDVELGKGR